MAFVHQPRPRPAQPRHRDDDEADGRDTFLHHHHLHRAAAPATTTHDVAPALPAHPTDSHGVDAQGADRAAHGDAWDLQQQAHQAHQGSRHGQHNHHHHDQDRDRDQQDWSILFPGRRDLTSVNLAPLRHDGTGRFNRKSTARGGAARTSHHHPSSSSFTDSPHAATSPAVAAASDSELELELDLSPLVVTAEEAAGEGDLSSGFVVSEASYLSPFVPSTAADRAAVGAARAPPVAARATTRGGRSGDRDVHSPVRSLASTGYGSVDFDDGEGLGGDLGEEDLALFASGSSVAGGADVDDDDAESELRPPPSSASLTSSVPSSTRNGARAPSRRPDGFGSDHAHGGAGSDVAPARAATAAAAAKGRRSHQRRTLDAWAWSSRQLHRDLELARRRGELGDDDDDGVGAALQGPYMSPQGRRGASSASVIFTSGSESEQELDAESWTGGGVTSDEERGGRARQEQEDDEDRFEADLAATPQAFSAGMLSRRRDPTTSRRWPGGSSVSAAALESLPLGERMLLEREREDAAAAAAASAAARKRRHRRAGVSDRGGKRSNTTTTTTATRSDVATGPRRGRGARRGGQGGGARARSSRSATVSARARHVREGRDVSSVGAAEARGGPATPTTAAASTGRKLLGSVLRRVFDVDDEVLDAFVRDEGPLAILDKDERARRERRRARTRRQRIEEGDGGGAREADGLGDGDEDEEGGEERAWGTTTPRSSGRQLGFGHEAIEIGAEPRAGAGAQRRRAVGRTRLLLDGREIEDEDEDEAASAVGVFGMDPPTTSAAHPAAVLAARWTRRSGADESTTEEGRWGSRGGGDATPVSSGGRKDVVGIAGRARQGSSSSSSSAAAPLLLHRAASVALAAQQGRRRRSSGGGGDALEADSRGRRRSEHGGAGGAGEGDRTAEILEPTTLEALRYLLADTGRHAARLARPQVVPLRLLAELARSLGWAVLGVGGGGGGVSEGGADPHDVEDAAATTAGWKTAARVGVGRRRRESGGERGGAASEAAAAEAGWPTARAMPGHLDEPRAPSPWAAAPSPSSPSSRVGGVETGGSADARAASPRSPPSTTSTSMASVVERMQRVPAAWNGTAHPAVVASTRRHASR